MSNDILRYMRIRFPPGAELPDAGDIIEIRGDENYDVYVKKILLIEFMMGGVVFLDVHGTHVPCLPERN
jgi:hypothetical protein